MNKDVVLDRSNNFVRMMGEAGFEKGIGKKIIVQHFVNTWVVTIASPQLTLDDPLTLYNFDYPSELPATNKDAAEFLKDYIISQLSRMNNELYPRQKGRRGSYKEIRAKV